MVDSAYVSFLHVSSRILGPEYLKNEQLKLNVIGETVKLDFSTGAILKGEPNHGCINYHNKGK